MKKSNLASEDAVVVEDKKPPKSLSEKNEKAQERAKEVAMVDNILEKKAKKEAKEDDQNKHGKKMIKQSKKPKNIKILGFHDLPLNTYIFDDVKSPKATIIVVHGMMEHGLRYAEFSQFLNENGYVTIASDLRGHGKTASSKDRFGFGEKDIYNETLIDLQNIIAYARETYKLPIYLFGHSYGSLLSQKLIQLCPYIEKCVLCATTNGSSGIMKTGGVVAKTLGLFKSYNSSGGILEKMCIQAYGNGFDRGNWLTRDEKEYDKYLADEYCGGSFPFSFYKSLITNMNTVNAGIDKIGNKKIMFIVGDDDPLSSGGIQVQKLYDIFLKHNIDVKLKIYHGARHELIHETNKEEIFNDVLNFYNA